MILPGFKTIGNSPLYQIKNLTPPVITGIGYQGQTLTATAGTWDGADTVTGQWRADGSDLVGETALTYTVDQEHDGANFVYVEIASDTEGYVTEAPSNNIHHWVETDTEAANFTSYQLRDTRNIKYLNDSDDRIMRLFDKGSLTSVLNVNGNFPNLPDYSGSLNGINVSTFNGDFLEGVDIGAFNFVHQGIVPFSIVCVGRSNGNNQSFITSNTSSNSVGFMFRNGTDSPNIQITKGVFQALVLKDLQTNTIPDSGYHILSVYGDLSEPVASDRGQLSVDGTQLPKNNVELEDPVLEDADFPVVLGAYGNSTSSGRLEGNIASLYIGSGKDEVQKLEGRFSHLYNIPLDPGHPYFSSPPNAPSNNPLIIKNKLVGDTDPSGVYPGYRIPTIQMAANGDILVFLEGRGHFPDDRGDNDAVYFRGLDGGLNWTGPHVIADEGTLVIQNPSCILGEDGRLHLLYARSDNDSYAAGTDRQRIRYMYSDDHGVTWTTPVDISTGLEPPNYTAIAPGPAKGIVSSTGRLIFPCYSQHTDGVTRHNFTFYSDDNGVTWERSNLTPDPLTSGCNECCLVQLTNGDLYMNYRNQAQTTIDEARRGFFISNDDGETWGNYQIDTALLDGRCQASMERWDDKILFCNPASNEILGSSVGFLEKLIVKISYDDCATWSKAYNVSLKEAGYSAIVRTPDDCLAIVYEDTRVEGLIKFDKIPMRILEGEGAEHNLGRLVNISDTSDNSRWAFTDPVDGWSLLEHKATGFYLTTQGSKFTNCTLTQNSANDKVRWKLIQDPSDTSWYWIVNKHSGLAIKSDDFEGDLLYMTHSLVGNNKAKFQEIPIGGDTYVYLRHKESSLNITADS